jgi:hypothetical protein
MARSNRVICPICDADVAIRINRNGFWQRNVLGFFGYYPWKCGGCGEMFLARRRGHGHKSNHGDDKEGVRKEA